MPVYTISKLARRAQFCLSAFRGFLCLGFIENPAVKWYGSMILLVPTTIK